MTILKSIRKQILIGLLSCITVYSYSPANTTYVHEDKNHDEPAIPAEGTVARSRLISFIKNTLFTSQIHNDKIVYALKAADNINSPFIRNNTAEIFLSRIEHYLQHHDISSAENVFINLQGNVVDQIYERGKINTKILLDALNNHIVPMILDEAKKLKNQYGNQKIPQTRRYTD